MGHSPVAESVSQLLAELPPTVTLVAAAKSRTPGDVTQAMEAGITDVAHNYLQEAATMIELIGHRVRWHFIGHLQRNKAKKAVQLFDIIETVDSERLARVLDSQCAAIDKVLPILIEVNSGHEPQKAGVLPEDLNRLVRSISPLSHLRVEGLMTMGPFAGDPEDARSYFRATKEAFDRLSAADIPNVEMRHLSMGMSHSYRVAIQEGATIIRIGTKIFGPRNT